MKNVFFTAIALVAFSAASMANTIEVKEAVVLIEKKVKTEPKQAVIKRDLCAEIASLRCEKFENDYGCQDNNTYSALYYYYYGRC
jgi:Skp family chaperone for outer membrane proteins